MKQTPTIERWVRKGKIILLSVTSDRGETLSSLGRFCNCLYIAFAAENFPEFKRAKLIDCDWSGKGGKRFDYGNSDCDANSLDWHGGCTFYSEQLHIESGLTIIKVGCDYSHYMDERYQSRDCGEELLLTDGASIVKQFEELIGSRRDTKELSNERN